MGERVMPALFFFIRVSFVFVTEFLSKFWVASTVFVYM